MTATTKQITLRLSIDHLGSTSMHWIIETLGWYLLAVFAAIPLGGNDKRRGDDDKHEVGERPGSHQESMPSKLDHIPTEIIHIIVNQCDTETRKNLRSVNHYMRGLTSPKLLKSIIMPPNPFKKALTLADISKLDCTTTLSLDVFDTAHFFKAE